MEKIRMKYFSIIDLASNFTRYMEILRRFKQINGYKMEIFWSAFFVGQALPIYLVHGFRQQQ